jgi:hypothetical protein
VDGWSGIVYVILSFLSSAAVSLPLSSDPPERISALYEQHRTAYLLAQILGLVGVVAFARWLVALRRHDGHPPSITITGALVAVAAVATNVAVLVLCLDAGLSATGVRDAARATAVTDDVLFACFALLTLALAVSRLPRWARCTALLAAAACAVRAVRAWWSVPGIHVVAPLLVLAVMAAVAIWILRRDRPATFG